MKPLLVVLATAALVCLTQTAAFAHGDLAATVPAAGSKTDRVPKVVSVTFTETPARGGSTVRVKDGCNTNVTGNVSTSERTMEIPVAGARPGHWQVSYQIVSAEDGHPSKGSYRFHVAGKPKCNAEPDPSKPSPDEGDGGDQAAPPGEQEDSGSLPLLPIAGGTMAIIIFALVVRGRAGQ
jgi:methionine-rich copper-binding protein CopC